MSGSPLTSFSDATHDKGSALGVLFTWRTLLGLVAGLALGLGMLVIAARGVQLGEVWSRLALARPGWVVLAVLTVLATTGAKVVRWYALLHPARRSALLPLARSLMVGKALNALLPARLGDLARIQLASERLPVSRAAVLGTLAAEKAYDALFFLISGSLALALVPLPSWLNLPLVGGTAGSVLLIVLVMAWPQQCLVGWFERWVECLPRNWGKRLAGLLRRMLSGLDALRDFRLVRVAGLWSSVTWALATSTNWVLFRAFGLDCGLGAALLLLVVLYAGVAPPSAPGRLGVFHALTVLTLETLGIDRVLSLAYATVLHAVVYLPEILPGAVLLGLRLAAGRLRRARMPAGEREPLA